MVSVEGLLRKGAWAGTLPSFAYKYIKTVPAGEETYWAAQAGLSDPTAALANHLRVNPSGPEARLFAWNHPTGGLRPLSRAEFTKRVSSAATAAGLPSFKGYSLRFGGILEQPTTRHSLRRHQIHGEMIQRMIYHLPASTRHDHRPIYTGYTGPRAFYTLYHATNPLVRPYNKSTCWHMGIKLRCMRRCPSIDRVHGSPCCLGSHSGFRLN